MAIKMRRGADADFRPEKMQPGELAVTVDGTRKVYAAFAAGDVKELSSKEDVDKTIASGLQSLETSTNNKLQSLEKKASSAVDKISSENQRVQEELSRYEYYTKTESDLKYTVAPRKEASSANGELKLTDADDGLSYLALQGNSEQYTNTASTNLFDMGYQKSLGLDGTNSYLSVNGEISTAGGKGWNYSYYIKVKQNTLYSVRGVIASTSAAFVFYNKDKIYISGILTSDAAIDGIRAFTTPANCEWIRISYGVTLPEIYEGALQTSVTGAIDTPSPEYPSEVRSVGDIPKDVNGVEIRNLLDEEWIKSQPESAWVKAVSGSNTQFRLQLGNEIKKKVTVTAFLKNTIPSGKSFSFTLGNQVGMNGASLVYNNAILKGTADYTAETYVNLYITVNGTTTATHSQMLEVFNYFNFMVTEAAEIDEYRPYIGSNNGLVKIESARDNLVNADINFATSRNSIIRIANKGQNIVVTQTDIADTARTMLPIKYEVGKTYTLYYKAYRTELVGAGGETYVAVRDMAGAEPDIVSKLIPPTQTEILQSFTPTKDGLFLWLYVQSQGGKSQRALYVNDLMIVEGEKTLQEMKALKYQPYQEKITWIPLRRPLHGLDAIKETVDKDGYVSEMFDLIGVDLSTCTAKNDWNERAFALYKVDERTKELVPYSFTYSEVAYYSRLAEAGKPVMITTQGFSSVAGWYFAFWFLYGYLGISKTSTEAENKQKILDALGGHYTIEAWYKLKNPNVYQIPAVYIETYEPETNVRCLNKVKPSDMTLDYKIAMSSLIKRLEALEEKTVQEV